ncbi:MAG: hypothetical protein D8M58_10185 [Calditrichaeota bacterium]|nr:MAG: hypothetical protein DWQ03_09560 [Calditrichota bacterium]MBL1205757.1 hypothetical protein [Calditrichota bacterium]NOG45585.1 hypothetical protein [Calditrichota bacterium]
MSKYYVLIIITSFILSCETQVNAPVTKELSEQGQFSKIVTPPLPDIEVIYENGQGYLIAGENSGWISYNPGMAEYMIKFEFLRDIITGGGNGEGISVNVIVKDKVNNTMLNKWYELTNAVQWYTFYESFQPGFGAHKMIINVPWPFYDGLGAKVTLLRNSTN